VKLTEYHLTPFDESRWQEVAALADMVVPYDLAGNREWTVNRQRFQATGRERRQYGVCDNTGRLVGYGAMEQQEEEPSAYRMFIVPAAHDLWGSAGLLLYDRLIADASELGARRLFLREYAQDAALIAFFSARGFNETGALLDLRAPAEVDVSDLRPLVHFLDVQAGEHRLVCPEAARTALGVAEKLGFRPRFKYVVLEKLLS
jgi:N-acetylglutamate synthase-like GNAT family acetyltransferase